MKPWEDMAQERIAFLYALYTRSAGDARQGIPYEELIDALGFGEAVTKRIQRALQLEGLVELTTVPRMTQVGRPVMDHEPRHRCHQTIGMTPQGMRLMEDIRATRHPAPPQASASPDHTPTV
jgi:hypothetical protein